MARPKTGPQPIARPPPEEQPQGSNGEVLEEIVQVIAARHSGRAPARRRDDPVIQLLALAVTALLGAGGGNLLTGITRYTSAPTDIVALQAQTTDLYKAQTSTSDRLGALEGAVKVLGESVKAEAASTRESLRAVGEQLAAVKAAVEAPPRRPR